MPHRLRRRRLVRMLGSWPLIADFARRLQIRSVIDSPCPSRGNAHLSHGQVALTLIAKRLTQPKAMSQCFSWAKQGAVREVFDLDPAHLNADRLGRCRDALAPSIDPIQGAVPLVAVRELDLDLASLHGDLTSVVLQGESPPEAPEPAFPTPAHGFGGEPGWKQLRVGEVVTGDGGVPIWPHTDNGNQADVGTGVTQREALRAQVELPECLVIGDSQRLSPAGIPKLLGQTRQFLAPLPKSADLDREDLALENARFVRLDSLAQLQERLPPEKRTTYWGQEVPCEGGDPHSGKPWPLRQRFVIRRDERAPCRKVRGQQRARAEAELTQIEAGVGKRPLKTAAQVQARGERVLERRRGKARYRMTVTGAGTELSRRWEVDAEARKRAEALEGDDVLLCSLPEARGGSSALLRMWKRETLIERRVSDWKGPLRVRPVFVTHNARMAARVLLLHLALLISCLLEREARRQLGAHGQPTRPRLLAGQVAAVPTGEKIRRAFEELLLIVEEDEEGRHRERSERSAEQKPLWHLLGIRTPVFS